MSENLDVDRFCIAISNFIDQEIVPQYDSLFAFGVRMISNIINRNGIHIIQSYSPLLKASGLMSSDGKINIDEVISILSVTFDQIGKVSIAGLTYSKKDLDRLHEIMKSYIPSSQQNSSS